MISGRIAGALIAAFVFLIPSVAKGANFAVDERFIVIAPDRSLADAVLARANAYRDQVIREWLGEAPAHRGRIASIHVKLSDTEETALTLGKERPEHKLHKVWLTTSRRGATGRPLYHEIVHVVLADQFPDRLPAWIEEGIASRVDDPERVEIRRRIVDERARSGDLPDFQELFDLETIPASDQAAYGVAVSLTEYLLSLSGKETLLRFGTSARRKGWRHALQHHYGIRSATDLRAAWLGWVTGRSATFANAE
ncbi:MAG: hypothetical protein ACYTG0_08015 [Planctomycetota bacterium]|jgi:hypothetical protein